MACTNASATFPASTVVVLVAVAPGISTAKLAALNVGAPSISNTALATSSTSTPAVGSSSRLYPVDPALLNMTAKVCVA
jgi:hypothetical protein